MQERLTGGITERLKKKVKMTKRNIRKKSTGQDDTSGRMGVADWSGRKI
jgi:hypothetical protein